MNPCDCRPSWIDEFLCEYGSGATAMAACQRVYFAKVVCPILCRLPWWFELPIFRIPRPEPDPWWEIRDLVGLLVSERLQLPNVDPQLVQRKNVEALTEMRKGFEEVLEGIDRELKALGS